MNVFLALAEPKRRSIIELLASNGELSSSVIARNFDITPAAISQHLNILRDANLVRIEKRRQQRIYSINLSTLNEVELWVKQTSELWNIRLDNLDKVLADSNNFKDKE